MVHYNTLDKYIYVGMEELLYACVCVCELYEARKASCVNDGAQGMVGKFQRAE